MNPQPPHKDRLPHNNPPSLPPLDGRPALAVALLALLALLGAAQITQFALRPTPYPVDAYYYLSKAENLMAGQGLTTYWNGGVDRKFFPLQSFALAPLTGLRHGWPKYWLLLSLGLYAGQIVVFSLLLARLEPRPMVRFSAVALWVCNASVLLWQSVPYSEPLATFLAYSAILVCAGGWRRAPLWRFALAALLGGLAVATRAEAAMLGVIFGAGLVGILIRRGPRALPWPRLALGGALYVAPFFLYWITLPAAEEQTYKMVYVEVLRERFAFDFFREKFWDMFQGVFFERWLNPYVPAAANGWHYLVTAVYWLALALALAGRLGRPVRWAAAGLLAYQALHGLWYYLSNRFNFLVTPLAAYTLGAGAVWLFREKGEWLLRRVQTRPGLGPERVARVVCGLFVLGAALTMSAFGWRAMDRQQYWLNQNTNIAPQDRDRVTQTLTAGSLEGGHYALSDDLWLAYAVGSQTRGGHGWIYEPNDTFYEAAFEPGEALEFLEEKGIGLIGIHLSPAEWFDAFAIPPERRGDFQTILRMESYGVLRFRPAGGAAAAP